MVKIQQSEHLANGRKRQNQPPPLAHTHMTGHFPGLEQALQSKKKWRG